MCDTSHISDSDTSPTLKNKSFHRESYLAACFFHLECCTCMSESFVDFFVFLFFFSKRRKFIFPRMIYDRDTPIRYSVVAVLQLFTLSLAKSIYQERKRLQNTERQRLFNLEYHSQIATITMTHAAKELKEKFSLF